MDLAQCATHTAFLKANVAVLEWEMLVTAVSLDRTFLSKCLSVIVLVTIVVTEETGM